MSGYVEGHGVKDSTVLHWVREKDIDSPLPLKAICGRPVVVGEPDAPSRPCCNCARRKAAYQNRSQHRLATYRI